MFQDGGSASYPSVIRFCNTRSSPFVLRKNGEDLVLQAAWCEADVSYGKPYRFARASSLSIQRTILGRMDAALDHAGSLAMAVKVKPI